MPVISWLSNKECSEIREKTSLCLNIPEWRLFQDASVRLIGPQRGIYDGVSEDCPRSRDVRGQLFQHQEQERNRAVAGSGRLGAQHL